MMIFINFIWIFACQYKKKNKSRQRYTFLLNIALLLTLLFDRSWGGGELIPEAVVVVVWESRLEERISLEWSGMSLFAGIGIGRDWGTNAELFFTNNGLSEETLSIDDLIIIENLGGAAAFEFWRDSFVESVWLSWGIGFGALFAKLTTRFVSDRSVCLQWAALISLSK